MGGGRAGVARPCLPRSSGRGRRRRRAAPAGARKERQGGGRAGPTATTPPLPSPLLLYLVEVRRRQPPRAGRKVDVGRVVHLAQVVEGARLFRVGQRVGAPVVRDGEKPFLDVDVGRAVLAHGAQFDEVGGGGEFLDGEQDVERADHVVVLRVDGARAVDHGVGGGALQGGGGRGGVGAKSRRRLPRARLSSSVRPAPQSGRLCPAQTRERRPPETRNRTRRRRAV